jgi:hypothetical protein
VGGAPRMPEPVQGRAKWFQIAVVAVVLVLAFVFARTCQQAQIRVSKEQAIAMAERQVDFVPRSTQIRLLRQGLNRRPFWFVSLSIRSKRDPDVFSKLALVKIDANTGKIENVQEDAGRDKQAAEAAAQEGQTTAPGGP